MHKMTTYNDTECHVPGAPRSQTGSACTVTVLTAQIHSDYTDINPAFGFGKSY